MSNKRYFDAILLLSELIGAHPSNSTFRTRRSICLMALGHHERARDDAIEAIKLDAANLRAYQKLIDIYLVIGGRQEIENAIQRCNQVLEDEETPSNEKQLQLKLKEKFEEYLKFQVPPTQETTETTASNGNDVQDEASRLINQKIAEERKNSGNIAYKAQRYAEALWYYSEAVNVCPDNACYLGNRSACQMMLKNYTEALDDAKKSIELDSKFEKGYLRAVRCCILLGDLFQADQIIKKFLETDLSNDVLRSEIQDLKQLRVHAEKARGRYDNQDYRRCLLCLDCALNIAQSCQLYKLQRAECLAYLGQTAEAIDIAQSFVGNCDAIFVHGLALFYSDKLETAMNKFKTTLQLDPDHRKAKNMLNKSRRLKERKETGIELFKSGKYEEAIAAFSEALDIDSLNKDMNSKLHYNRALVYTKLGKRREAIKDCTSALKINQNYLKALLIRASCFYALERFREAVKDYTIALTLDNSPQIKKALNDAMLQLRVPEHIQNCYKTLGIRRPATESEIKKAFHKKALTHHPDKHPTASQTKKKNEETKFKKVQEAYTVLIASVRQRR